MKLASNDRNREEEKTDDMMIMAMFSLMPRPLPIFQKGSGHEPWVPFVCSTLICHVRIFPLQEREDELREQMRRLREMSVISYQAASYLNYSLSPAGLVLSS